jgi:NADH-quinone oxidoreductase subunit N
MLIVSFGFKVAAVPFHMWVPDVYEGAPTSVTAFMSAGPKVAGFAVLLRVFVYALQPLHEHSTAIIAGLAVLTMGVGNVLALSQTNIKRMLAYSSIAHAGYALVGLAAGTADGASSVMLYVLSMRS